MESQANHPASHGSTASGPASAFTCFSALPKEIQLQVWDCAISNIGPRVVEFAVKDYYKKMLDGQSVIVNKFTSTCPIPNVLHTCCDSRTRALKRWKPVFASREKDPSPKIFFDFNSDVLFFLNEYLIHKYMDVDTSERKAVRKLAFDLKSYDHGMYFTDGKHLALRLRRDFGKLDQIVFLGMKVFNKDPKDKGPELSNIRQTVITLSDAAFPWTYELQFARTLEMFRNTCKRKKWHCPEMKFMDYQRSDPDAGEEDWEDADPAEGEDVTSVSSEKCLYGEINW